MTMTEVLLIRVQATRSQALGRGTTDHKAAAPRTNLGEVKLAIYWFSKKKPGARKPGHESRAQTIKAHTQRAEPRSAR